jgi:hypothetical protein
MRSTMRFLRGSLPVTVAAAVALMLAAPAALANTSQLTLVFAVQPTTTQVQTTMTPAVVVDVENSQGQLVTWYNGPVTLTYAVNPVGAPEPANNVVDAVHGLATFPALTFSAVGFGFELQASARGAIESPSQPFSIVTQLVHCQPGQACQTETVSSAGTSGFAVASAAATSDMLTATGGGFPSLSCTTTGGVVSFTVTDRSKTITMTLAKSLVQQAPNPGTAHFNICWGSPARFTTKDGTTSAFNPANNEYEGLLPDCSASGPSPCITSRHKTNAGVMVTTISAPAGDPHGTY